MKIKLGYTVKDRISGFTGIVDHIAEYAHQGPMVGVKPNTLKDGQLMESQAFDATQLEILSKTPPFPIPEVTKPLFKYGEKVRCKFTGYEGTVGGRAFYLNGCARVYIIAPYDPKVHTKGIISDFLPESQLESVEPPKEKPPRKTDRGGPAPNSFRSF